ncbi:MAG: hypothetical protein HYW23_03875 [Candidatus Aenigmarchaeota archaeon]|nr:hypothetical protein [Candidatus Aenigmarchaeota archaeon]
MSKAAVNVVVAIVLGVLVIAIGGSLLLQTPSLWNNILDFLKGKVADFFIPSEGKALHIKVHRVSQPTLPVIGSLLTTPIKTSTVDEVWDFRLFDKTASKKVLSGNGQYFMIDTNSVTNNCLLYITDVRDTIVGSRDKGFIIYVKPGAYIDYTSQSLSNTIPTNFIDSSKTGCLIGWGTDANCNLCHTVKDVTCPFPSFLTLDTQCVENAKCEGKKNYIICNPSDLYTGFANGCIGSNEGMTPLTNAMNIAFNSYLPSNSWKETCQNGGCGLLSGDKASPTFQVKYGLVCSDGGTWKVCKNPKDSTAFVNNQKIDCLPSGDHFDWNRVSINQALGISSPAPLQKPALISPLDASVVEPSTAIGPSSLNLEWMQVSGALSYKWYVNENPNRQENGEKVGSCIKPNSNSLELDYATGEQFMVVRSSALETPLSGSAKTWFWSVEACETDSCNTCSGYAQERSFKTSSLVVTPTTIPVNTPIKISMEAIGDNVDQISRLTVNYGGKWNDCYCDGSVPGKACTQSNPTQCSNTWDTTETTIGAHTYYGKVFYSNGKDVDTLPSQISVTVQ